MNSEELPNFEKLTVKMAIMLKNVSGALKV